jgi:hypothetical protein
LRASETIASSPFLERYSLATINKTWTRQLCIYFALDDNNDNDAVNDYICYYSGDNPMAHNRPQLVVIYQWL